MPHLASASGVSASRAGLVMMAASVLLLFAHRAVFASGPLGRAAQAVAILLLIWARVTFGLRSFHASAEPTAGGLVTSGPYKYIRHPIYASVLLFVWAAVASHPSARAFGCGLLACAGAALRIAAEEHLVVQRYPEYAEYASRTKRFIPHLF